MGLNRPSAVSGFVLALFLASAAVNVLQANRIRNLLEFPQPQSPIGRHISAIHGTSLRGERRTIEFGGTAPLVLYYFSTSCAWCERNWPNIKALAHASRDRNFRVIGVAAERDVAQYATARSLDFEILQELSLDSKAELGLLGTPHTLVISADGVITHDWRGAFAPKLRRQVEELFQIALPGVLPARSQPKG